MVLNIIRNTIDDEHDTTATAMFRLGDGVGGNDDERLLVCCASSTDDAICPLNVPPRNVFK